MYVYGEAVLTRTNRLAGDTVKSAAGVKLGSENGMPRALPGTIGRSAENGHCVRDGKITIGQFAETQLETLRRMDVEALEQNSCRSHSGTHLRTNRRSIGP